MKQLIVVLLLIFSIENVYPQSWGCTANINELNRSELYLTCGNRDMDLALQREVDLLRGAYGVSCQVWIFDDGDSPNADARPDITNPNRPDGTVRFGMNMLQEQLSLSNWGATVPFVIAHEFGHIKAMKNDWDFRQGDFTVKKNELFADFTAGLYMWDRQNFLTTDVVSTIYAFMQLGDLDFNSKQHHGTPSERKGALMAGYNYMRNFRSSYPGSRFTDDMLYEAYSDYMVNNIH